jgi:glycosyltransferase involved in cell wall biosynthesis
MENMKIAIVTPFHREPVGQLAQCMRSVHDQRPPPWGPERLEIEHVLVGDGGDPRLAIEAMKLSRVPTQSFPRVISLPVAHRDWGNCARAVGALDAVARGFDAIGFLDGDNWLEPSHVASLLDLHASTGALVCTTSRTICRVDGSPMYPDAESDGDRHVDTNCFFFLRGSFYALPFWGFVPESHAMVGDRVFWQMLKRSPGLTHAHNPRSTVNYRTRYAVHYRRIDEQPPAEAKENAPAPTTGITLTPRTLLVPLAEP